MDLDEPPIKDQTAELEADLKLLRDKALSAMMKARLANGEAELQQLRERERLARPFPARLQATTGQLERLRASRVEAAERVATFQEQLAAAEAAICEIDAQEQVADDSSKTLL